MIELESLKNMGIKYLEDDASQSPPEHHIRRHLRWFKHDAAQIQESKD
jgi:hypothetical protein